MSFRRNYFAQYSVEVAESVPRDVEPEEAYRPGDACVQCVPGPAAGKQQGDVLGGGIVPEYGVPACLMVQATK